jgi:hypothetical protein
VPDGPEDEVICVKFRPYLEEKHGIRFAPTGLAKNYSVEGEDVSGTEFGFHRVFNLPNFNGPDQLSELLDAIDDSTFCNLGAFTLIERLIRLGRKKEALRYARRLAGCPTYFDFSGQHRAMLAQLMTTLFPMSLR